MWSTDPVMLANPTNLITDIDLISIIDRDRIMIAQHGICAIRFALDAQLVPRKSVEVRRLKFHSNLNVTLLTPMSESEAACLIKNIRTFK